MAVIETKSGDLNIRYVRWVKERRRAGVAHDAPYRERFETVVVDDEGKEHEVLWPSAERRLSNEYDKAVVAANAPMEVLDIWIDPDEPEAGEVSITRMPIVAWRVGDMGWPTPVAVGCPDLDDADNKGYFIELPHQQGYQACGFEGSLFTNLDHCIAEFREHLARQNTKRTKWADKSKIIEP